MTQRAYKPCGHTRDFSSTEKQESRHFIVDCWRAFFGQSHVPRQYWTLCGPMTDDDGVLQEGSELRHLESEGLFTASQFIGVELLEDVYHANLHAVSQLKRSERPTLHHGDIIDVLYDYQYRDKLAASIVNLDTTSEVRRAVPLLRRTLNVLNHIDGPTMVAWNVITGRHWPKNVARPWDTQDNDTRGHVVGYVSKCLLGDTRFQAAYRHGWDMFPEGSSTFTSCRYDGAHAKSKTQMTTYVFVRRRKACGDNCSC